MKRACDVWTSDAYACNILTTYYDALAWNVLTHDAAWDI